MPPLLHRRGILQWSLSLTAPANDRPPARPARPSQHNSTPPSCPRVPTHRSWVVTWRAWWRLPMRAAHSSRGTQWPPSRPASWMLLRQVRHGRSAACPGQPPPRQAWVRVAQDADLTAGTPLHAACTAARDATGMQQPASSQGAPPSFPSAPPPAGCYAEYVVCDEAWVAAVPSCLPLEEAAGMPLVGLTAWQVRRGGGLPQRTGTPATRVAACHSGSAMPDLTPPRPVGHRRPCKAQTPRRGSGCSSTAAAAAWAMWRCRSPRPWACTSPPCAGPATWNSCSPWALTRSWTTGARRKGGRKG
jgi:hypothetical protein